ncbi:C-X-C motif chemokine 13-like [Dendropsophus ebraccatus]|uniref:C-X-C motif chemokine 13-like n=1 Tax=Dendropsophus ebraccatus TaxID=150705 RepID=UPI0038322EA3
MRSSFVLLWIILSLHCFFTTFGIWESRYVHRRCKCFKVSEKVIQWKDIQHVIILDETQNCREKEIIIFLKNSKTVCVSPKAEWVKMKILKKKVK